jgi:hypothetical protein
MNAPENNLIPPDILADLEEVCRQAAAGGVRDPELLRRVAERSQLAREEVLQQHGVLEIAASLVREIRDEE